MSQRTGELPPALQGVGFFSFQRITSIIYIIYILDVNIQFYYTVIYGGIHLSGLKSGSFLPQISDKLCNMKADGKTIMKIQTMVVRAYILHKREEGSVLSENDIVKEWISMYSKDYRSLFK